MDSLSLQGNISKLTLPVSYELQEVSAQLDLQSPFCFTPDRFDWLPPSTDSAVPFQKWQQCQESNPGQLGKKHKRSICAMPLYFKFLNLNVLCLWVAEKPTLVRMSLETFSKTSEARVFIRINLIRKHRLLKNVEEPFQSLETLSFLIWLKF